MKRRLVGVALLLGAAGAGCELVAGLGGDAKLLPPDAGSTGTGGAGSTSSTATGGPGTGGHAAPSFTFAISDTSVNVPYGGMNLVDVALTPSDGFSAAVDVTVQGAPAGLMTMPLTIPAGMTTGKLQVSAGTTLMIGTAFTLTLTATSGAIVRTAMVPAVVTGKPGDLDVSFGAAGIVTGPTSTGELDLNDIREVADGKLVVGGVSLASVGGGVSMGLRYLPNGMPDTTFNSTGAVSNKFCGCTKSQGGTISVAREVDGRLLFIGWGDAGAGKAGDLFLFRYTDLGTMDILQGDNGTEDIDLGGDEHVTAAALLPASTSVVAAGTKNNQLFVARFADRMAFGDPDTTFASPSGFLVPALGGTASTAGALDIDAAGNTVVAGSVTTASGDDLVLLRLTTAGSLDPAFGSGGIVTVARTGNQHGSAVVVQPDGKILVAADTDEGTTPQLLVQRFLSTGVADSSFGTAGVVTMQLGGTSNTNFGGPTARMALMLDGRIVVAGNGVLGTISGPVFARFLPEGSPDPVFGTGGELAVYVGMNGAMRAMSLASDGKLLIAGSNGHNPGGSFIARLWN